MLGFLLVDKLGVEPRVKLANHFVHNIGVRGRI